MLNRPGPGRSWTPGAALAASVLWNEEGSAVASIPDGGAWTGEDGGAQRDPSASQSPQMAGAECTPHAPQAGPEGGGAWLQGGALGCGRNLAASARPWAPVGRLYLCKYQKCLTLETNTRTGDHGHPRLMCVHWPHPHFLRPSWLARPQNPSGVLDGTHQERVVKGAPTGLPGLM